jgi:hypothetical protein
VRSLLHLLERLLGDRAVRKEELSSVLPGLWRASRGRDAALAELAHGIDDGPVADWLIIDSGCVPPEGG